MELGSEGETLSSRIPRGYSLQSYYLVAPVYLFFKAILKNPANGKYSDSFWNHIIVTNRQDKLRGSLLALTDCKCLESSHSAAFIGPELVW